MTLKDGEVLASGSGFRRRMKLWRIDFSPVVAEKNEKTTPFWMVISFWLSTLV